MGEVISATTAFVSRSQAGAQGALLSAKRARFLMQSSDLLYKARSCSAFGKGADAFEFAYQAALRAAGAWVASSKVATRKRLPSSAWDQLALVDGRACDWAATFRSCSKMRSRLISGLDVTVEEEKVLELIALAAQLWEEVMALDFLDGENVMPQAA